MLELLLSPIGTLVIVTLVVLMVGRLKRKAPMSSTKFLNVDLELGGKFDLTPLLKAFNHGAHVVQSRKLTDNDWVATLELNRQPKEYESAIRSFVGLVGDLLPADRALWNQAYKRSLSVGVEVDLSTQGDPLVEVGFSVHSLRLASDVGAKVGLVLYRDGAHREARYKKS